MTLKEIAEQLKEIIEKLEGSEELTEDEIKELEEKAEELEEEKKSLLAKAEKRSNTLEKIKRGITGKEVEKLESEEKNMEEERNIYASKEYRSAFLKKLQGKDLNETEERAMSSASESAGAVIPTTTLDLVMEKLEESAPLLKEIELINVKGNVTFAVEADATEANIHAENATMNDDGDVLISVTLTTYEITKYITISKTVANMSIDAFEKWLVNMISKRIARKITKLIISGTGSNQPKGVDKANTWGEDNSVTVASGANLTTTNVTDLTAKLPGAYDANAKWLMSKKTLLGDFRPLQNKSKDDIFVKENGKYYVEGYEVMLDDAVTLHEAFLGDFKMYVGNLADDITIETDKKLSSNSYEFLGCAMFDGKPAIGEAFVKLVKGE